MLLPVVVREFTFYALMFVFAVVTPSLVSKFKFVPVTVTGKGKVLSTTNVPEELLADVKVGIVKEVDALFMLPLSVVSK